MKKQYLDDELSKYQSELASERDSRFKWI